MKTIVPLELTDEELSTIADFIDGHKTKRTATRKEVVDLSTKLIEALIKAQVAVAESIECGVTNVGSVIKDINKGGWSMLDWD